MSDDKYLINDSGNGISIYRKGYKGAPGKRRYTFAQENQYSGIKPVHYKGISKLKSKAKKRKLQNQKANSRQKKRWENIF